MPERKCPECGRRAWKAGGGLMCAGCVRRAGLCECSPRKRKR